MGGLPRKKPTPVQISRAPVSREGPCNWCPIILDEAARDDHFESGEVVHVRVQTGRNCGVAIRFCDEHFAEFVSRLNPAPKPTPRSIELWATRSSPVFPDGVYVHRGSDLAVWDHHIGGWLCRDLGLSGLDPTKVHRVRVTVEILEGE